MRSIMQEKQDHTCYLCMMLHSDFSAKQTQEHHVIFGTANRRLSEKYGLKVYLCLAHHEEGKEAVHKNATNALILKKNAQRAFEKRWPDLDFRKIFGKNFLDDADRQQASKKEESSEQGFQFLNINIGEIEWYL